ncbi:MAG: copper chaperone PCu(A)C, partial [Alphaproteobacteria bacterium]
QGAIGERSRVRFRVVNEGSVNMHLLGISTEVAEHAVLIADVGDGKLVQLESINIPADSTLDLTTSHLRYEIYPLNRTLRADDEFAINLDFVTWKTQAQVHVH